jgi:hypothetical protein
MNDTVIHKALATMPAVGDAGPPAGAADGEAARDLALINARFALVPLAPGEVDLRRMGLANDRVDRTYERFSPAFLARLAATIIGKSVLVHHDKRAFPIGRFYAAEVVREPTVGREAVRGQRGLSHHGGTEDTEKYTEETPGSAPFSPSLSPCTPPCSPCLRGEKDLPPTQHDPSSGTTHWLIARYYMLRSEATAELRRQIDAGVYSYVSIGFRGGAPRCDLCSAPFAGDCPHWPGRVYATPAGDRVCTLTWEDPDGSAEAVEGSLVWLGAQIGAQHVKSWRDSAFTTETRRARRKAHGEGLEEQQPCTTAVPPCTSPCPPCLRGENPRKEDGMQQDLPQAQERIAQLEREMAEYRERAAEAARLEPLARDGERYRADLVAEITRLAGLVGAAKEATFLCESLTAAGAERLKELKAEYERRVEEKLPPQGCGRPADDPRPLALRDSRAHSVL